MLTDGLQFLEGSVTTNLVLPVVTESGKAALTNLDVGEIVWQTTGQKGVYVYDGTVWQYGLDTEPYSPPPTTLAGYGITDGLVKNTAIVAGTGTKITYDSKGLVLSSTALSLDDIPAIPTTKLTGQITAAQLPTIGATAYTYNKVYVDANGRIVSGETATTLAGFGITDAIQKNTSITAGTGIKVTYDAKGLVLSSSNTLLESDIPDIHTTKLIGKITDTQLPLLGDTVTSYFKVNVDGTGRVTSGENPTTLTGYGITDAMRPNTPITAGTGIKVSYDANGLVLSSSALVAADIPQLDAGIITSGRFSANFLPFIETLAVGNYTKVLVDKTGRVIAGENPTTLAGYGITDAMQANVPVSPGTSSKVEWDNKGLIIASYDLTASDIPDLDISKIKTGILNADMLPTTGVTPGSYYKVTTDNKGRITAGVDALAMTDIPGLIGELSGKAILSDITDAIDVIKDGVDSSADTFNKLYNLILSSNHEITVANTAARQTLNVSSLPTNIFVIDDGDGNWALYKALSLGLAIDANVVKLSDPDLLNTALGYTPEGTNNKDTDPTLFANSDIKYPSQKAVKAYADTKLAIPVAVTPGTGVKITYNQHGLVTGSSSLVASDFPEFDASKITSGVFAQELLPTVSVNTTSTYVKVKADEYGRVTAGVTALDATDIPSLDASKITTGRFTASMLPAVGASEHTYTKVEVDGSGRIVTGSNPTTLEGYGITDAMREPPSIVPATGIKITYDNRGLVVSSENSLALSDIPNLPLSKITSGVLETTMLPLSGVTAGRYKKVTVDRYGRVTAGEDTLDLTDITGLSDILATKVTVPMVQSAVDLAVTAIKNNVPTEGNNLNALYDLIRASQHEVTVTDITARNEYVVETLPTNIYVINDGDDKWALYRALFTDVQFENYQLVHTATIDDKFIKISDRDLMVLVEDGNAPESIINKSSNILLDGVEANNTKYPTQLAVKTYVDNRLSTISDTLTDVIHVSALPPNADILTNFLVLSNDERLTDNRPPLAHTHLVSDIDGLSDALDAKVPKGPGVTAGTAVKVTYNTEGLITGTSALTADDITEISASKITTGTLSLDRLPASVVRTDSNGMLPAGLIPAISLTGTLTPATVLDMQAITDAQIGTVAVIAATNETYVMSQAGWTLLNVPTDHVITINGKTGVIGKIIPEDTNDMFDNTKPAKPLLAARLPAFAGDITSVEGTNTLSLNTITGLDPAATYTAIQVNEKGIVVSGSTAGGMTQVDADQRYVKQVDLGAKNAANGYVGLNTNGYIDAAQLPFMTGDVTSANGSNSITLKTIVGLDTSLPFTSVNVDIKGRVISGTTNPVYNKVESDERFTNLTESGHKNAANGYAGLTVDSVLAAAQLPAFTGDVTSINGSNSIVLKTVPGLDTSATYTAIKVNSKGIVVSGTSSAGYTKEQIDSTFLAKADSGIKNAPNGYAGLNANSKIDAAYLPQLVINRQNVVTTLQARNELSATVGDIAIVLGTINKSYILAQPGPSDDNNWVELSASATVSQINGKTGSVTLTMADITGRLDVTQLPNLTTGDVILDPNVENQFALQDTGVNSLTVGEIDDYTLVTVNSKGLVIQGSKPTTAAELGILDILSTSRLPDNDDGTSKLVTVGMDGKINTSLIPAISVSQIFTFFETDASKDSIIAEGSPALTATQGAMAIVGGTAGATYILASSDPTVLEDWVQMQAPGGGGGSVISVNGQTGNVLTITYADIDLVSPSIVTAGTYNTVTVNEAGRVTAAQNTQYVTLNNGYLTTSILPALSGDLRSTAGSGSISLANSGVVAGTYRSVTVDAKGRVINATNPTTMAGYGITDVVNTSRLGAVGGVATLTSGGSLTTNQVPGFLGDVTNVPGSLNMVLSATGVAAGTYKSVTVDAKGRVIAANNPTTLAGYGITDSINVSKIDAVSGVAALSAERKISSDYLPLTGVTAGTYTSVTVDNKGRVSAGTNPEILLLSSIGAASGTAGLDADKHLTVAQIPIFTGGDVLSVGGTANLTLAPTGIEAGTYTSVTVDTKGRVISASSAAVAGTTANTYTGNQTAPAFISNVAQGTAPLQVTSTTLVSNLNVNYINNVKVEGVGTIGQVLTLDTPTTASWQESGAGSSSVAADPNTTAKRTTDGSLYATNFYSTSDEQLKRNIADLTKSFDVPSLVNSLAPKTFTFTADEGNNTHYGLIAQDVEKILPSLVSTVDGFKSVNYVEIISILLANIQQLNERVAMLEGK
jgi:phage-related tail fiber protein